MSLPSKIRDRDAEREALKTPSRTGRFKSQKHRDFIRTFACSKCGETAGIEVAHVRLGSDGAMGRKPSDYYCVSLCGGIKGCHAKQHQVGEETFWAGVDIQGLIQEFNRQSPAWPAIKAHQKGSACV